MTPTQGLRTLVMTGLRIDANLGILVHEKSASQPIVVDAELKLGDHPLLIPDHEITHVLDYRKVRQAIIDQCTVEHVDLLESLVGKVVCRLLQLSGVIGVSVKITKPEAFGDCAVAIRVEASRGDAGRTR